MDEMTGCCEVLFLTDRMGRAISCALMRGLWRTWGGPSASLLLVLVLLTVNMSRAALGASPRSYSSCVMEGVLDGVLRVVTFVDRLWDGCLP